MTVLKSVTTSRDWRQLLREMNVPIVGRKVTRNGTEKKTQLNAGPLLLDTRQMRVSVEGSPINVTPLEFKLLNYLLHNRGRVISQEELATNIYFQDQEPDSNAVEVLLGRLRRKLKTDVIKTRRGFGYIIEVDGE